MEPFVGQVGLEPFQGFYCTAGICTRLFCFLLQNLPCSDVPSSTLVFILSSGPVSQLITFTIIPIQPNLKHMSNLRLLWITIDNFNLQESANRLIQNKVKFTSSDTGQINT